VERFATQYPHAVFAKVDVDAQQQIAATYQVTAMFVNCYIRVNSRPTFKLFKDGREVDSVQGANAGMLEAKIKQHYVAVDTSASSGSTSSASGYPDITSNIDIKNVNLTRNHLTIGGMLESTRYASRTKCH
jgi:thiol-disulfide isomerase/thioredoxin